MHQRVAKLQEREAAYNKKLQSIDKDFEEMLKQVSRSNLVMSEDRTAAVVSQLEYVNAAADYIFNTYRPTEVRRMAQAAK